eukprot:TRINITY_DN4473_c0_g1_i1.p1 TRINITY_DN4473_c0_g1~~TRINITY_DN4473_c0_g1_i1.p1  ORF type:complete len:754 (-),score=138.18 TRINITY_DN4473_c0_g1_i1:721-2847(-)
MALLLVALMPSYVFSKTFNELLAAEVASADAGQEKGNGITELRDLELQEPKLDFERAEQVTKSANLTLKECVFQTDQPAFRFFWDDSCTEGMHGCFADNKSLSCRFCGEAPYESIPCPPVDPAYVPAQQDLIPKEVSWIIVGGGAGGCAAAAALADAGEEVLLLERGLSDWQVPETQQATTWPFVVNTKAAEHIRMEDGVWGTAAKVLGGGTSINGGYSFEESPEYMREEFNDELDLDVLFKSSKILADNMTHPVQPGHFAPSWQKALCGAGHGCDTNVSLRWKDGSWVPLDTFNTSKWGYPRRSSAVLIHERAHLKNLKVLTSATVHRILFQGKRATGVRVSLSPAFKWLSRYPVNITATKGVIVSAGAIYTPQILQMSGIGTKGAMERLGIKNESVVANLPVGSNFIDRLVMNLCFRSKKDIELTIGWIVALNRTLNMTFEVEAGGHINSEFAVASLALDEPSKRHAHLRNFMKSVMRWPHNQQPSLIADNINKAMDMLVLQHKAHSRGWVEAVSLDPNVPPKVKANYYDDHRDFVNQWKAVQELLKIAGQPSLREWVQLKQPSGIPQHHLTKELKCSLLGGSWIGKGARDSPFETIPCLPFEPAGPKEWGAFFKEHQVSSYHYFGTAAFGSVLEGPELRVKGIEGLHVADASVFPNPTRVNPQHMIMVMGHYVGTMLAKREKDLGPPVDVATLQKNSKDIKPASS